MEEGSRKKDKEAAISQVTLGLIVKDSTPLSDGQNKEEKWNDPLCKKRERGKKKNWNTDSQLRPADLHSIMAPQTIYMAASLDNTEDVETGSQRKEKGAVMSQEASEKDTTSSSDGKNREEAKCNNLASKKRKRGKKKTWSTDSQRGPEDLHLIVASQTNHIAASLDNTENVETGSQRKDKGAVMSQGGLEKESTSLSDGKNREEEICNDLVSKKRKRGKKKNRKRDSQLGPEDLQSVIATQANCVAASLDIMENVEAGSQRKGKVAIMSQRVLEKDATSLSDGENREEKFIDLISGCQGNTASKVAAPSIGPFEKGAFTVLGGKKKRKRERKKKNRNADRQLGSEGLKHLSVAPQTNQIAAFLNNTENIEVGLQREDKGSVMSQVALELFVKDTASFSDGKNKEERGNDVDRFCQGDMTSKVAACSVKKGGPIPAPCERIAAHCGGGNFTVLEKKKKIKTEKKKKKKTYSDCFKAGTSSEVFENGWMSAQIDTSEKVLDGDVQKDAGETKVQCLLRNFKGLYIILDLNGVLIKRWDVNPSLPGVFKLNKRWIRLRPGCIEFLCKAFSNFKVGIWSTMTQKNVLDVCKVLEQQAHQPLPFFMLWSKDSCYQQRGVQRPGKSHVLADFKPLSHVWKFFEPYLGFHNTVLVDDSPYKACMNNPYNCVFPDAYEGCTDDNYLNDMLWPYLEKMRMAENIQAYIANNPLGQKPIVVGHNLYSHVQSVMNVFDSSIHRHHADELIGKV